ncbi:MAG: molecular chaperone DnaJ [Acidimicrobiales bacterium]
MSPQREWFEKDYYKTLGVSDSATPREITSAYRKLAKKFHPDANPGAEDRFKDISSAYDVLGDADKRKEYDEVRRMGPVGMGGFGPGGSGGAGGFNFQVSDLGDLLGGLFGRNRGGAGRGPGAGAPQRGEDLEAELYLSFADAIGGVTTAVNLTSDAACSTCNGTGAAPGSSPSTCPTCRGRGLVEENQGVFSFSQPCATCAGRGSIIERPCATCGGRGIEHRARKVKVRIPPGVEDGQRIRIKSRGAVGRNGGPPGHLFVTVRVGPHDVFGRRGSNLTITVPVTFPEAALGASVTVPTMDAPVTLKVPAGTRSGRTFRVAGRGAPRSGGAGDLLVTVEVIVPSELTEEQRRAIQALDKVSGPSPREYLGA